MRLVAVGIVFTVVLSSCIFSPPHINYAVSGESYYPFYGAHGSLITVSGVEVDKNGSDIPKTDQRFFAIIFLTPGLKGNSSGTSSTLSTPRLHVMTLADGIVPATLKTQIEWDKGDDIVRIEKKEFKRGTGTVFVVEKTQEGSAEFWQLNPSRELKSHKDVLAFAKSEMPVLESLRLATFDVDEYVRVKKELEAED